MKIRLAIIFLLFTCSAHSQSTDLKLLESINGPVTEKDHFWRTLSTSAFFIDASTPLIMYATATWQDNHELKIHALETAGALLIAGGITFTAKNIIKRPRPFESYPEQIIKKDKGGGYSFPSGHTSMSFAAATSISLTCKRWYVTVPAFTYASAVAYSRMYLGVHYPSDVLAGAITGCGSAYLSFHLQKWLLRKEAKR